MKKIISIILSISFIGTFALSDDNIIEAKKIKHLGDIKPASSAWLSAKPTKVILYPQKIVRKSKDLNISEDINPIKKVTIQALYDNKNISFLMTWRDNTKNIDNKDNNLSYVDGFAIQFAQTKEIKKLPYIDMGSEKRGVIIYSQKANKIDQAPKLLISKGAEDTKEIEDQNISSTANMEYANNGWKGTLTRPLIDKYIDMNRSSIPISFSIWDIQKDINKNIKFISNWIGVSLNAKKSDPLLNRLTKKVKGNIEKGKQLYITNCEKCHSKENNTTNNLAPNLSNIGYSTVDYLIESIVNPNAIIVKKDNQENNSTWYTVDNNGTKISIMPSFEYLDKTSIIDIITYLKTLTIEVKK